MPYCILTDIGAGRGSGTTEMGAKREAAASVVISGSAPLSIVHRGTIIVMLLFKPTLCFRARQSTVTSPDPRSQRHRSNCSPPTRLDLVQTTVGALASTPTRRGREVMVKYHRNFYYCILVLYGAVRFPSAGPVTNRLRYFRFRRVRRETVRYTTCAPRPLILRIQTGPEVSSKNLSPGGQRWAGASRERCSVASS